MKVLHLTTHLEAGGITSYIQKLVQPLRQRGIEIEIFSSGGAIDELFLADKVKLHTVSIRTKSELSPKLYFALPKLVKLVRSSRVDLMHAHTRVTQVLAWMASKLTGVPLITTCHGYYKKRLGRSLLPAWGNCVITISEPVKDAVQKQFDLREEQVETIMNGVDFKDLQHRLRNYSEPEACRGPFGLKKDDFVIGITGRLVPMKGHRLLLNSFRRIKKSIPKAKLLIVGEGKIKPELIEYARHLEVESSSIFAGNLHDIVPALAAMDVFVFPVTSPEGFGLSPLEAMGVGVPVVTSRNWPVTQYFSSSPEGIIVEPLNEVNISEKVCNLYNNKELREKMGRCGRLFTESRFGLDRMADSFAELYARILEDSLDKRG